MSDELERRVRDALRRATLPAAPETLRAQLERLPTVASPAVDRRRRAAWLLAATVAVVLAVGAIWLPGRLPGTAATPSSGPSPSVNGSSTPLPAGRHPVDRRHTDTDPVAHSGRHPAGHSDVPIRTT